MLGLGDIRFIYVQPSLRFVSLRAGSEAMQRSGRFLFVLPLEPAFRHSLVNEFLIIGKVVLCFQVFPQSGTARKELPTSLHGTCEGLLPGVCEHVSPDVGSVRKALCAAFESACERLLATVDAEVAFECVALRKGRLTALDGADIRPLSRMFANVALQTKPRPEHLVATWLRTGTHLRLLVLC